MLPHGGRLTGGGWWEGREGRRVSHLRCFRRFGVGGCHLPATSPSLRPHPSTVPLAVLVDDYLVRLRTAVMEVRCAVFGVAGPLGTVHGGRDGAATAQGDVLEEVGGARAELGGVSDKLDTVSDVVMELLRRDDRERVLVEQLRLMEQEVEVQKSTVAK